MKITKVGRFVVQIELDRIEGSLKYYDAVLCKDNKEVKICKGCIGEKSADYWGAYLEKLAKKLEILYSKKDSLVHNLMCYSTDFCMDESKELYEKEWNQTKEEVEFVEAWIKELEG